MARRTLFANEYFELSADDDLHVARLVRSVTPFPAIEAIEATFTAIERAGSAIPHGWALLIDARKGPMRNDPAFEQALAHARGRMMSRFSRVAVLIHTAIGKLQVSRYAREDHAAAPQVFDDQSAAIAFLTAKGPAR